MKTFHWAAFTVAVMATASVTGVDSGQSSKASHDQHRKRDPSVTFFSTGALPLLQIEITPSNVAALNKDARSYVPGTVRAGANLYQDVGVHLKGGVGSFRPLGDRPSLTLNFDKFVADQKFHGIDKLHLNNSVQDPSYMMEVLCGELFRAAGIPAPRAAHARVELNGRDLGLYVLKEGFDKTFLKRHFRNNKGNLYDPGFRKDITERLEKLSGAGAADDQRELAALAAAAREEPAHRFQALRRTLDIERFVSFVAMEAILGHWDGYSIGRNNYRVYHDPDTDKVVFLPHGMDQFWDPNAPIQPPMEGLIAAALLETAEGQQRYRQRVEELFTNFFHVEVLTQRVDGLQALLRPVLETVGPRAAVDHDRHVDRLREIIAGRAASIEQQLRSRSALPLAVFEGSIPLASWEPNNASRAVTLRQVSLSGKAALHINATGFCISSWRTRVLLKPGAYRFQGRVKTSGILPLREERDGGAGLRLFSESFAARPPYLTGDTDWKELACEFKVSERLQEILLLVELRASQGEAWFDASSLKVVRVGDP